MSKLVRTHLYIEGLVQGVFYRSSMRAEATRLGVTGWVKNLYDGRVEAVAEGEKQAVQKLLSWCYQGPPSARVTDVKVFWEEPTGEFSSFEIVY